jgi:microcin C transport system substrate-binding protein
MKRLLLTLLIMMAVLIGCTRVADKGPEPPDVKIEPYEAVLTKLPKGLTWRSNDKEPIFASRDAEKGGIYRTFLLTWPHTFRYVGPDSNSSFRSAINANRMGLVDLHPNTGKFVPALAREWAFGRNGRTVYYRLDPDARWSDGQPVTVDDFIFTLEFMRSPHIHAPWYNEYYSKWFEKIIKYDDHTMAVVGKKKKPDLLYYYGLSPTPRHYYRKIEKGWVEKYNWAVPPNTGPYRVSQYRRGRWIRFSRKKDWWAQDRKFYRGRYNVDEIVYRVIRDENAAWEYFRRGKLDSYSVTQPSDWHKRCDIPEIKTYGWIHRRWVYNDKPRPDLAIFLNQDHPLFQDRNVRYGIAHSLNVRKVIEEVLYNDYTRLEHIATGYGKYSNDRIKARRFDLRKADYYFQRAGWKTRGDDGIRVKDGKRLSFRLSYSRRTHEDRMVVMKNEAERAGVQIRLQLMDRSAHYKEVLGRKHEAAYSGWSASFRPQFWGQYHSVNLKEEQSNNITATRNPVIDRLIESYREATRVRKRRYFSRRIQKQIHREGATITMYHVPYFREAYWAFWRFPEVMSTKRSESLFLHNGLFWFDPEKKKEVEQSRRENKKMPRPPEKVEHWRPSRRR